MFCSTTAQSRLKKLFPIARYTIHQRLLLNVIKLLILFHSSILFFFFSFAIFIYFLCKFFLLSTYFYDWLNFCFFFLRRLISFNIFNCIWKSKKTTSQRVYFMCIKTKNIDCVFASLLISIHTPLATKKK